jgi:CheY-like chemotaxis protein
MVVDRGMPQMEGVESIECIRASSDADIRDIPAAALTAFARSEDRTKALDHGFEMHYAKPVDPANSFPRSRHSSADDQAVVRCKQSRVRADWGWSDGQAVGANSRTTCIDFSHCFSEPSAILA